MGWFSLFIFLSLLTFSWMSEALSFLTEKNYLRNPNFQNQPGNTGQGFHGSGQGIQRFGQNFGQGLQRYGQKLQGFGQGPEEFNDYLYNPLIPDSSEYHLPSSNDGCKSLTANGLPFNSGRRKSDDELDSSKFLSSNFRSSSLDSQDDVEVSLFNRNFGVKSGKDEWRDYSMSRFIIILIPGYIDNNPEGQKKYTRDYCDTLKNSFLNLGNYTVICFDWKPSGKDLNEVIALAQKKGLDLDQYIQKTFKDTYRIIHIVAHDLGCIVAQIAGINAFRPIDFIFGIDQRILMDPANSKLYISKDAANMVELIYSDHKPISEVQRNFYFVPKNDDNDSGNAIFVAYKAFAQAIAQDGNVFKGVVCPNLYDFKKGNCDKNEKIPMWSSEFMEKLPEGLEYGDFFLNRP